ncbi:DUF1642 domain-containing protein [Lactococcus lactis]|uniref:DUF1642 domain-containing protein n=1 Tax=Lactococcus lactis TaxID=1358 RepID=UPI002072D71A|nr:DUF1642 domain-containing protein [Lactococcus lactis]MCM6847242.1 DUF1642 domain-containing protein [Lactococcus lactis]
MDKTFKQRLEILPIKNIEHPVGNTKYYVAVHVKSLIAQADEEYQELFDKYSNLNDSYEKEVIRSSKLESQIIDLKSQLQQQALPVVPECVAEYIERCKSSDCGLIWAIRPDRDANDNSEEVYDWLFPNGVKLPNGMYPNPYEPDNLVRPDKENQIKFVRSWLDGYTVEKPQLFYLKNKIKLEDVGSDLIGYINLFLTNDGYLTSNINCAKKFTSKKSTACKLGAMNILRWRNNGPQIRS